MEKALPGSAKAYEALPDEADLLRILAKHDVVELTRAETSEHGLSFNLTTSGVQRLRYSSGLSVGCPALQQRGEV